MRVCFGREERRWGREPSGNLEETVRSLSKSFPPSERLHSEVGGKEGGREKEHKGKYDGREEQGKGSEERERSRNEVNPLLHLVIHCCE